MSDKHLSGTVVELITIDGLGVTDIARTMIENAGYTVHTTTLDLSDLPYVKRDFGMATFPGVRTSVGMISGMPEIRARFSR
jgi:hypothetical protein